MLLEMGQVSSVRFLACIQRNLLQHFGVIVQ